MSKQFIIQCPECQTYHKAKIGFFASKKMKCTCGCEINIKEERYITKTCAHCGNSVVYDQAKGEDALCTVCGKKINLLEDKINSTTIACPKCACKVQVRKDDDIHICEICGEVLDVQNIIAKNKVKEQEGACLLKFDGDANAYVWKHPIENFPSGSRLIVHEGQEALFIRKGEIVAEYKAGGYQLEKPKEDKKEESHSEIYFINKNVHTAIKWGTDSKVRLLDPASGMQIELGACGQFNVRVVDSRAFMLQLVGISNAENLALLSTDNLHSETTLVGKFKALIVSKVKTSLAKVIRENQINVLELDEHLDEISTYIKGEINEILVSYGIAIVDFFITSVAMPNDDPNFQRLKQQYADRYLKIQDEKILEGEAEARQRRKIVDASTSAQELLIAAQAEAEAHRLRAQAEADEMRMKGYTYQDETARQTNKGLTDALQEIKEIVKEAQKPTTWNCSCGQKGNTGNFCSNCGKKKN